MVLSKFQTLKNQLLIIVLIALLLPSAAMLYDIYYASKTDEVLIAETEKKLEQITSLTSNNMYSKINNEEKGYSNEELVSIFNLVAEPLATGNYPGVRLCLYVTETNQITIHGYLHEFGNRLPEEKQDRDQRIYNEAKEGIAAVQSSGTAITRLGNTWDDQFLEHLVPIKVNNQTVAVLWAEERMHPIFAKGKHVRLAVRYVVFIVFSLGVSFTLLTLTNMVNRIRSIKNGLMQLEDNLNNQLPEMPGEMGQITRAINNMAHGLAEKEKLIEHYKRQEDLTAMGRLTTEIAHELRAPVSIIQATAEAMESSVKDASPIKDFISRIEKQVDRHGKLINELLEFGRPNPGAVEILDINILIGDVISYVSPLLEKSDILLDYTNTVTEPRCIDGNADKLKQVFINLIVNAIDAMHTKGKLTIKVQIEKDMALITVRDTGKGIPQEDLQNIFEPFYTRKAGGSGLGLAISKRIIQIHGGSIQVESKANSGSIFTVCLPLLTEYAINENGNGRHAVLE